MRTELLTVFAKPKSGAYLVALAGVLYGTLTSGAQWLNDLGFSTLEVILFSVTLSIVPLTPVVYLGRRFYNRAAVKFYASFGAIYLGIFLTSLVGSP